MEKCPVCKKQAQEIYVLKTFITRIPLTKSDSTAEAIAGGYTDLYDFIKYMLVETGKPKIIGCENCIS